MAGNANPDGAAREVPSWTCPEGFPIWSRSDHYFVNKYRYLWRAEQYIDALVAGDKHHFTTADALASIGGGEAAA